MQPASALSVRTKMYASLRPCCECYFFYLCVSLMVFYLFLFVFPVHYVFLNVQTDIGIPSHTIAHSLPSMSRGGVHTHQLFADLKR